MNKKISIEQIEKALYLTSNNGIGTKCYLMFGFPGDCVETAIETVNFFKRNKNYINRANLFSFSPVPNSPIYNNIVCDNFSWKDYKFYNQLNHWWGDDEQYQNMKNGYYVLEDYIISNYGEK